MTDSVLEPRLMVTLIAAAAENGVIGNRGDMPWRLPSDLKLFKAATLGKPVIMGRKTLESIGRALPGRSIIVVSRQDSLPFEDVLLAKDLEGAVAVARKEALRLGVDEVMIAGGGEIYRQSIDFADRILLTRVLARPNGDAWFPEIDSAVFERVEVADLPRASGDSADLRREIYCRRITVAASSHSGSQGTDPATH